MKSKKEISQYFNSYYSRNKDKIKQRSSLYYQKNKEQIVKRTSEYAKRKKYNLSLVEITDLLNKQDNQCGICKIDLLIDSRYTHVDHDHVTGKVRGILCSKCNIGLGHFKGNVVFLTSAIQYLNTNEDLQQELISACS